MIEVNVNNNKVRVEAGGTAEDIAKDATIAIINMADTVAKAWKCNKYEALFMLCCAATDTIGQSKGLENCTHVVFPTMKRKDEKDA